jgi:hypothetical protein
MNFSECELNALRVSVCLGYRCGSGKKSWLYALAVVSGSCSTSWPSMPAAHACASLLGDQQFTLHSLVPLESNEHCLRSALIPIYPVSGLCPGFLVSASA